jgi:hemolysin activation/secretion protein
LTAAVGTSAGHLPVQRRWYLGGTQTIRGISPDPMLAGNAFWLARGEIARPLGFLRIAAFGDIGWSGDRENFTDIGRPLSGAGLGFSIFDGAARLDVARGIYPTEGIRVSFYLGSRF